MTFAASFYGVGNIWMTQLGWRLWPYVSPGDFAAYHAAWWALIRPVVFPVAAGAFLGSIVMIWWRPAGVTAVPVWLSVGLQVLTYTLTAVLWGRWQAQTHYARLPNGALDPMYLRNMNTHWIRVTLITLNGLVVLWMMIQAMSNKAHRL